MALITNANLKTFCDKLAAAWDLAFTAIGTKSGSPAAAGTVRAAVNNLQTAVLGIGDYEQSVDLLGPVNAALTAATGEAMFAWLAQLLQGLNYHLNARGREVAGSIIDLPSYLNYYNGGSGGALFSCLLCPEMRAVYGQLPGAPSLPAAGVMSPALQSDINSSAPNGMGTCTYSGTYTAGVGVTTGSYSAVSLVAEVHTAFASGTGAPTITVAGVSHLGDSTTTWGATWGSNNPSGALSGVTITPAITAMENASVVVSSSAGIVPGSVLTINKGLVDQELVVVTAVADGTHLTARFALAHSAGATIDGWDSIQLTSTPSGRRCVSVSGITIGLTGQTAGLVYLNGVQDRQPVG